MSHKWLSSEGEYYNHVNLCSSDPHEDYACRHVPPAHGPGTARLHLKLITFTHADPDLLFIGILI